MSAKNKTEYMYKDLFWFSVSFKLNVKFLFVYDFNLSQILFELTSIKLSEKLSYCCFLFVIPNISLFFTRLNLTIERIYDFIAVYKGDNQSYTKGIIFLYNLFMYKEADKKLLFNFLQVSKTFS